MPMIIIGRRPANSTGITGRLPMEKPRIVEGGLTEWDVLTETFWCRSLDNLIFTKGSARHTEADVTGIYYSQRCDVIGWKAGMPIVQVTSWGLRAGTKTSHSINRNFGMSSTLSANSPGGYLIRGDTYVTTTTLTTAAASMAGIPGNGLPTEFFGISIVSAPVTGSAATAGWVLARGNAEKFYGGIQRSEKIYLFTAGPTSGTWY